ncbi:hypothetical protein FQN60_005296 [Etheostoma spectabile]|uniref:Uncharacterized protein n=1 Tax=Etheostoma spectabile TaxID=54343 RepID=A0A5J5CFI8_9PERO|nr:hypothetical protein FQN60_005296 [Etheostoma spectabile]
MQQSCYYMKQSNSCGCRHGSASLFEASVLSLASALNWTTGR